MRGLFRAGLLTEGHVGQDVSAKGTVEEEGRYEVERAEGWGEERHASRGRGLGCCWMCMCRAASPRASAHHGAVPAHASKKCDGLHGCELPFDPVEILSEDTYSACVGVATLQQHTLGYAVPW